MNTKTLNLLPSEDFKNIGRERLSRFLTLVYAITASILLVGGILMLPTYFFLFFQKRGIAEQIAAAEQSRQIRQIQENAPFIEETNIMLRRLADERISASPVVTEYVTIIVKNLPPTLTLTTFSYTNETSRIELRGTATNRASLLSFIETLRAHALFENVESPVANILREQNISFTISFNITERRTTL